MKKGTMFCNRPNAVVGINRTARFSVISCGGQDNGDGRVQFPSPTGISERVRLDGKRMNIFLDVDDVYTRRLIERAFQHASRKNYFNISLGPGVGMDPIPIPDHCQFQWAEYERIDWHNGVFADGAAKKKHGASSYCIRKGISRKAQLAHYTNLHICKNPHSILKHAIPQTKVLDCWSVWEDGCTISNQEGLAGVVASLGSEIRNGVSSAQQNRRTRLDRCLVDTKTAMLDADHDFDTGTDKEAPIWILKGSTTNKGAGIYIVHLYEQVVDHCWSESEIREWVLQRYIARPLLLNKRKFHIRAYALAVSSLRVYLSRECLTLCAGTRYNQNDTSNLTAHITNTAYQAESNSLFKEENNVLQWGIDDIVPILIRDGTCQSILEATNAVTGVVDEMCAIVGELFQAYQSEFGVFAPIENCFEHYGIDFMIDSSWRVYLLEVNPGPDFKQTGSKLESVIENLMASTIDVALLPEVTGKPCDDHGNLVLVYDQKSRRT